MLRTTLTAIASTAALLAVSEPMDPPVAQADTVKDALADEKAAKDVYAKTIGRLKLTK